MWGFVVVVVEYKLNLVFGYCSGERCILICSFDRILNIFKNVSIRSGFQDHSIYLSKTLTEDIIHGVEILANIFFRGACFVAARVATTAGSLDRRVDSGSRLPSLIPGSAFG